MSQEPPDGWVAMDDTLVPAKTIAGYAARGEELQGGCQAHGCRRRCWIDPHARYEVRLRDLPLATLQNLFRCNRLDGCGFAFTAPRSDQSVRLADLYGRPNVRIRIRCRSCGWTRSPRPEEVAGVLARSKTGGAHTRVHAAPAAMAAKPCPACKKADWSAEVVWLRTDTAIWRAKGESLFDGLAGEPK